MISQALYERHPFDDEGVLSARRAAVVSTPGLARLARRIDLGAYLYLGEGEAARGARSRPGLLASAFEAVAGAVFLDLGWDAARTWLLAVASPELDSHVSVGSLKSPKSRLQELTQRRTGERPDYKVIEVSGPDHQRNFVVEVVVAGEVVGRGEGSSRRAAETAAADSALSAVVARAPRPDTLAESTVPGADAAGGRAAESMADETGGNEVGTEAS